MADGHGNLCQARMMIPAIKKRLDAFAAFACEINHRAGDGESIDLVTATHDLWGDIRSLIVFDERIDKVARRLLAAAQAHSEAHQDNVYERTMLHGWFIAALADFYRIMKGAAPRL